MSNTCHGSVRIWGKSDYIDLEETTIQQLERAYPSIDIRTEVARAHVWTLGHEKRRPANVWRFLRAWFRRSPKTVKPLPITSSWWTSEARTIEQGVRVGIVARPGESMEQLHERISERLRGRNGGQPGAAAVR